MKREYAEALVLAILADSASLRGVVLSHDAPTTLTPVPAQLPVEASEKAQALRWQQHEKAKDERHAIANVLRELSYGLTSDL